MHRQAEYRAGAQAYSWERTSNQTIILIFKNQEILTFVPEVFIRIFRGTTAFAGDCERRV